MNLIQKSYNFSFLFPIFILLDRTTIKNLLTHICIIYEIISKRAKLNRTILQTEFKLNLLLDMKKLKFSKFIYSNYPGLDLQFN